uniref:HNH nuclease domain-containing protein n=1 Tax=Physcomitrium patens TaxID=3218 RepID=A0A7I4EBW2_PHYPA
MLLSLTKEEKAIDPTLGYPTGYAKLCRYALAQPQGALTPFAEGPPQCFVPYSPTSEELQLLKEWDAIFPLIPGIDKEAPNAHEFAEELWEQLDHLGNAGFDPAKFRVDAYGNVLYWSADPSSPLSWEVDHWFPHSRGGLTAPSNLQIVQWQARQRKKNRLEFLVPWWDLQHGVSINQFLSTFASKNAEFRRRYFALFFAGGEDEKIVRHHVGDCGPWPPQHRGKRSTCGLAGAAIVPVRKEKQVASMTSSSTPSATIAKLEGSLTESLNRQQRSLEEVDELKRGVQNHEPGSRKEIKEHEPVLVNHTTAHIKEKYRVVRDFGKENNTSDTVSSGWNDYDRQSVVSNTMQKELRLKKIREEGKREKEKEVSQLEETVRALKAQNEKERIAILELEGNLSKHKQKVEKQRRWAETQSSYRLCLERMIRDTMHQSISYKEQARLNQAACNALMARLDCQKMTCEVAEKDLLQRYSQREALAALVKPETSGSSPNKPLRGRDIVDVSSCLSLVTTNDGQIVTPEKGLLQEDVSELHSEDEIEEEDSLSLRTRNGFSFQSSRSDNDALLQRSSSTGKGKGAEKLPREGAKRKAISLGVAHIQPTKQAVVHRRHFGQVLESNHQTPMKIEDGKEDESMQHNSRNEPVTAKQSSIHEHDIVTHHKQDNVIHSNEKSSTRVLACQNSLPPVILTTTVKTVPDCEPSIYVQEIIEVEAPPLDNDSKRGMDELMQEVIVTHEDKIKNAEGATFEHSNSDDERIKEIGKSNIDKWLHVLLNEEFPRISTDSPNNGQPPLSPALSALSMAALRGSVELEQGKDFDEFLKKECAEGLKGRLSGIMRKLSVRQSDEESVIDLSGRTENRHDLRNTLKFFEDFTLKECALHGQHQSQPACRMSSSIPESVRNWPEGGIKPKGGADWLRDSASTKMKSSNSKSVKEEPISSVFLTLHKKSASEDIEGADWEIFSGGNSEGLAEPKDGSHHRHGLRATLKACSLKWRKSVKRLDKSLQDGSIPLQDC